MLVWLKRLLGLVFLGAIVALFIYAFLPKPLTVDIHTVERGELVLSVDEDGKTRIRDHFVVSAPLTGELSRIDLEPGDPITARRTLIAQIRPVAPPLLDRRSKEQAEAQVETARANLDATKAALDRAQSDLRFSEQELERLRSLKSPDYVSRQQIDAAEYDARSKRLGLVSAERAIRVAEQEVFLAQTALERSTVGNAGETVQIFAPVSGSVLKVLRKSAGPVTIGEALLELGDPSDLEIAADVLSTDAVRISAGQEVLIEQWGGDSPLNGRVRRIEPAGFTKISALGVEEQRVNVLIDLTDDFELWESLGDEYRVEVRVILSRQPDVLRIPVSSLFRSEGNWAVFLVQDGRVRLQKVSIGRRNSSYAEVLDGLGAGDLIVLHPSDSLEDGMEVVSE